jgi:hypothetical protein
MRTSRLVTGFQRPSRSKGEGCVMLTTTIEMAKEAGLQVSDLLSASQKKLDAIFTQSRTGPIPNGNATGTAIVWPGTLFTRLVARFVHNFAWQGKIFTRSPDGRSATLENKVTSAGVEALVAHVYYAPSWLDGKECIVLDYSKTSLLARRIRDEIREIAPHLYLGKVWWGRKRLVDFVLEFPV